MAPQRPDQPTNRQLISSSIRQLIIDGLAPWQKPWGAFHWPPHNPITGATFQGVNRIALAKSELADPRWLTFNQLEALGLCLKEDEESLIIEAWGVAEKRQLLGQSGQPLQNRQGQPQFIQVNRPAPLARNYRVYNASQLTWPGGQPLEPLPPRQLTWLPNQRAEAIIQATQISVAHDQTGRTYFDRRKNKIHLPPKTGFTDQDAYYAAILHELAHWVNHKQNLFKGLGRRARPKNAQEEVLVEITAWMLCQDLGLARDPKPCATYLADWLSLLAVDQHAIVRLATMAETIKKYLLNLAPAPNPKPVLITKPVSITKGDQPRDQAVSRLYRDRDRDQDQDHKREPTTPLLKPNEFLDPPDRLPFNYSFDREKIARVTALNRLTHTLLRPGLLMEANERWRRFADHLAEISQKHWTWDYEYKSFLREAKRVAKVEIDFLKQTSTKSMSYRQLEVPIYNGVLTIVKAARGLELPLFWLAFPQPAEPPLATVHPVARAEKGDKPLTFKVFNELMSYFKPSEPENACRFLVLSPSYRLLAIFLVHERALDFTAQLNSPDIDLLKDHQAEQKAFLWKNREIVSKNPRKEIELTDNERAELREKLRALKTPPTDLSPTAPANKPERVSQVPNPNPSSAPRPEPSGPVLAPTTKSTSPNPVSTPSSTPQSATNSEPTHPPTTSPQTAPPPPASPKPSPPGLWERRPVPYPQGALGASQPQPAQPQPAQPQPNKSAPTAPLSLNSPTISNSPAPTAVEAPPLNSTSPAPATRPNPPPSDAKFAPLSTTPPEPSQPRPNRGSETNPPVLAADSATTWSERPRPRL